MTRKLHSLAAAGTDSQSDFAEARPHGDGISVRRAGSLIINADDWGSDIATTKAILQCVRRGTVSSASAMVFMKDSEHASTVAQEYDVDTGLHLNLTTPFSASRVSPKLVEHQLRLSTYLRLNALARVIYHPWLSRSFEYLVKTQIEEYARIYGAEPTRIDGHHHAHLCSNILVAGLLPRGVAVRRYFSFEAGQDFRNRLFRRLTDAFLVRRYRVVDFLFSLPPTSPPERLKRIFSLASQYSVEVETHPISPDEYRFLMGDEIFLWTASCPIARRFLGESDRHEQN
jgi:chitin disaccharide deacetylase